MLLRHTVAYSSTNVEVIHHVWQTAIRWLHKDVTCNATLARIPAYSATHTNVQLIAELVPQTQLALERVNASVCIFTSTVDQPKYDT